MADDPHRGALRERFGLNVHGADGEGLCGAGMASAARMREVGRIYGRTRIAGGKDVVHTVAGRAVRHGLRALASGEAVIAVGERRHAIGPKIVGGCQSGVPVAAAARDNRDARGTHRRLRLARRQNYVLAVAVRADGRVRGTVRHRLAMNTGIAGLRNLGVARSAGGRNIPVIDFRTRVARFVDRVAPVTIRTGSRVLVAGRDGAPVNAQPVRLGRMGEWNLVRREEFRVRVARRARVRQIFLATGEEGSCEERILWMGPWHDSHVGTPARPRFQVFPAMTREAIGIGRRGLRLSEKRRRGQG